MVGFSGGVTSAWCAGWALKNYPREEVILLFHDTKEEDADTYRFLREMALKLDMAITERSDGRSVTELARDEGMLPNNRAAFCSRVLKVEPGNRFMDELRDSGVTEVIKVVGFSANETDRVQRAAGWSMSYHGLFEDFDVSVAYPLIWTGTTKQECADWVSCEMGVALPRMYEWSDRANCVGCVRGGKAYWLAVKENAPEVFEQRKGLEEEFGHTFSGRYSLAQIESEGLFRQVGRREAIEIGPCECGS